MSNLNKLYQEYGEYNIFYNQLNLPSPSVEYAWRRTKKLLQDEILKIIKTYQSENKISIADLGCGNGALLIRIAQSTQEMSQIEHQGYEISNSFIKYGNQASKFKQLSNIKFDYFNIEKDYFPKKYDLIICSEVLEHLKNPKLALQKIYSSLNNNGHFLLSTPNSKNIIKYPFLFLKKLVSKRNSREISKYATKKELKHLDSDLEQHLYVFSNSELKKLLKEIGFSIVKTPRSTTLFGGPFLDNHPLLFSFTIFLDKIIDILNIPQIGWDNIFICKKN